MHSTQFFAQDTNPRRIRSESQKARKGRKLLEVLWWIRQRAAAPNFRLIGAGGGVGAAGAGAGGGGGGSRRDGGESSISKFIVSDKEHHRLAQKTAFLQKINCQLWFNAQKPLCFLRKINYQLWFRSQKHCVL